MATSLLVGCGSEDENLTTEEPVQLLSADAVNAMVVTPQWTYDESAANGNNYYGLFNSWGVGAQIFTSTGDASGGDRIHPTVDLKWSGHLGEAYGLLSGMVFDPESGDGMVYIIGGQGSPAPFGDYSTFYSWEEELLTAMYDEIINDDTQTAEVQQSELDSEIESIMSDPDHELSSVQIAVLKGGELAYTQGYGRKFISDDGESDLMADANTKYRIASISKVIVGVAAWTLADEGLLDMDADISDYLGYEFKNPNYAETDITSRMLLSHTSTLTDSNSYNFPISKSISDYLLPDGSEYSSNVWNANNAPGTWFQYANINMGVMASVIEKVSGKRFDVYAREAVLEPLGMNASYNVQDFADEDFIDIATLYRKRNNGSWDANGPWYAQGPDQYEGQRPEAQFTEQELDEYTLGDNGTLFGPQGSLRASAEDLTKLMQMFINKGEIK